MFYSNSSNHPIQSHFEICTLPFYNRRSILSSFAGKHNNLHEIIWVSDGEASVQTTTIEITIRKGHTYIFSDEPMLDITDSGCLQGYYFALTSNYFQHASEDIQHIFSALHYDGNESIRKLALSENILQATGDILLKIQQEHASQSPFKTEITRVLLKLLFLYLFRSMPNDQASISPSREFKMLGDFRRLLQKNFTSKKQVADYAAELHVTPSYLNQVIKKASGHTASYLIQQQIILQAQHMARYTDCSMKQIAYQLGFFDTAHFSKFFKCNSGLNFTRYKKELFLKQL